MPNAKVLEAKKAVVAELTEKLQNAASGVLVDYKGITVAEDTALRNELRKNEVEYAVVKNTLTRFAVEGAGLSELSECLNGTTSLALSHNDPIAPMRVINKFSKDIAVYNLFSRIGIDEGTDQKTYLNRYNAAIKFLTLVAEGTVSIGTETEDPASAAAGGFKVKSNSRLFTREKMRGM